MQIRARVRKWLGLVDLPSLAMFKAMEMKQAERHAAIILQLNNIEKRLIGQHVERPRTFEPAVLDWDTVQAIALQSLRDNPEKEGN